MFNFDSLVFQTVKTILSIPTESPIDVFENEQGFCSNISNYKFPVKNRNNFLSCLKQYLINNKVDDILNVMKSLLIYNSPLNQLFELIKSVFSQKNEKKSSVLYFLLFQHFASLKNEEMKQNSFPNSEKLKNFINDLLTKHPPITTEIAIELYKLIESLLIDDFDLQTLEIFVNLSPFLSDQTTNVLSIFPCKIIQLIEKSQNLYFSLFQRTLINLKSFVIKPLFQYW